MIDAMSVAKRDIMLMIVIAIAAEEEAGIYFNKGLLDFTLHITSIFDKQPVNQVFAYQIILYFIVFP